MMIIVMISEKIAKMTDISQGRKRAKPPTTDRERRAAASPSLSSSSSSHSQSLMAEEDGLTMTPSDSFKSRVMSSSSASSVSSSSSPHRVRLYSCLLFLLQLLLNTPCVHSSWDQWWTYDGISGVEFWGLLNPKWSHCNKGRRQSPVDINPDLLLYDPGLTAINVNGDQITGQLVNTGRGLQFKVSSTTSPSSPSSSSSSLHSMSPSSSGAGASSGFGDLKGNSTVIISGGPLSYEYSLHHMLFHYGRSDDRGSEHTISSTAFPAEFQLYFFNSQLYNSWEEAVEQPNGLCAISALVQLTRGSSSSSSSTSSHHHPVPNSQLKHLFHSIESVKHKGSATKVHKLSFSQLLPSLKQYVTYEGSLTQPSCVETVQWIVSNKPLYMTSSDMQLIRNTIILEGHGEGNFRPIQPMNSRSLRTNIETPSKSSIYSPDANKISGTSTAIVGHRTPVTQPNNSRKLCSGKGFITYKANIAIKGLAAEDGMLYN